MVSEPPEDDLSRWPSDVLRKAGLVDDGRVHGVRRFLRV